MDLHMFTEILIRFSNVATYFTGKGVKFSDVFRQCTSRYKRFSAEVTYLTMLILNVSRFGQDPSGEVVVLT